MIVHYRQLKDKKYICGQVITAHSTGSISRYGTTCDECKKALIHVPEWRGSDYGITDKVSNKWANSDKLKAISLKAKENKAKAISLKSEGKDYQTIADILKLKVNTIKNYIINSKEN